MPAPDRKRFTAFAVAVAILIVTPLAVVATDRFVDVPTTNVHHDDITWLRDADVTRGCNPPANTEFCPGDPVLRQQMASFMRRLAENRIVDAATALEAQHATNADTVEGYQANEIARIAYDTADVSSAVESGVHLSTSITAPEAGYLSITYNAAVTSPSGDPDLWGCLIGVDDTFPDAGAGFGEELDAILLDGCTAHLVYPVGSGTHAVEVEVATFVASARFGSGTLSVEYVPFGPLGTSSMETEAVTGRSLQEQLDRFMELASASGLKS